MLSKEALLEDLQTTLLARKLFFFESIDSTNACAKALAQAGTQQGAVVVAEHQTDGRGRHGRTWHANPGQNLLFSVLLRPALPRSSAGLLTFFAAVSVARGIEQVYECRIECKWPNDLLLRGRKVCGILLENSIDHDRIEYSVIGVGINANQSDFDAELNAKATSLLLEMGRPVDRVRLFSCIMAEMETAYREVRDGNFIRLMADWHSRCKMFGKQVTVGRDDDAVTGKAVGLNDIGGLILETAAGRQTIYAGDIHLSQD